MVVEAFVRVERNFKFYAWKCTNSIHKCIKECSNYNKKTVKKEVFNKCMAKVIYNLLTNENILVRLKFHAVNKINILSFKKSLIKSFNGSLIDYKYYNDCVGSNSIHAENKVPLGILYWKGFEVADGKNCLVNSKTDRSNVYTVLEVLNKFYQFKSI